MVDIAGWSSGSIRCKILFLPILTIMIITMIMLMVLSQ